MSLQQIKTTLIITPLQGQVPTYIIEPYIHVPPGSLRSESLHILVVPSTRTVTVALKIDYLLVFWDNVGNLTHQTVRKN